MSEIRIGISGWTYAPWRKTFYPPGLSGQREFEYATRRFSAIEINGTFYRTQKPDNFRAWYRESPPEIKFAVKGSQFITHSKRLKDVRLPLANFFASGVLELREKLGPILWQFPPQMKFDAGRFAEFFELLPRTPRAALTLAEAHDMDIDPGSEPLRARTSAQLRYAVEIRNDSFKTPEFIDLLRAHNIAYVIADTADRWVYAEDLTADFLYIRLHGFKELYSGGYPPEAIRLWAKRLRAWRRGLPGPHPRTIAPPRTQSPSKKPRDAYIFFDNDAKVNAPFDAADLMLELADESDLIEPAENPREISARRETVSEKARLALQERAQRR